MADKVGMQDIRDLDINKTAVSYENEALIFKKEVRQSTTKAREIRYFTKSSGFLSDTAPAAGSNVAAGARPFVLEQSWTRETANVRKYFFESIRINMEDESDSAIEVTLTTLQDLAEKVAYDVDNRIVNVATEDQSPTNINTVTTTAAWDAGSGQDPLADVAEAIRKIRENTKRPFKNRKIYMNAYDAEHLLTWILSDNSTNINSFKSEKAKDGIIQEIMGCQVIVSENVPTDYAIVGNMKKAVVWKQFTPLTTAEIKEEGIGKKFRVWEEGEAILEKPKYITLISNTQT